MDCHKVSITWTLFQNTRRASGLSAGYTTWKEISRGLLSTPAGPSAEDDLRWDTASAFSINTKTPWDILRAQLLWAIWCQRVAHAFKDEHFHVGVILWHAWRNTIYCAMEAYKELFRHKWNEEKRQEMISCFQKIWTAANMFGRLGGSGIKWNLTPNTEFLPRELAAWTVPPIRVNRLSPSPDVEAEFAARADFPDLVHDFIQGIGENWQAPPRDIPQTEQARMPAPNGAHPGINIMDNLETQGPEHPQAHNYTTGTHQHTSVLREGNPNDTQSQEDMEH